jgi:two-component system repressor protein LuxO
VSEQRKPKVLLVEDSASLALAYREYLRSETCIVTHCDTGAKALEFIESELPEVILLDLNLPDVKGMDILRNVHENGVAAEVIVITAHGTVDVAVDAMRYGAFDFLVKPFDAKRLRVTLRNALERHQLKYLVDTYRETFDRKSYYGFIGSSLPMQGVYRIIQSAAPSKATVFITGESGTGKEVCAEAIHRASPRRERPFVAINCAAIPRDLMESEIFGHVKGAFTGAQATREGAASRADGGTLFLDEICEMDLDLQSKLLRFTQTGRFIKVGSSKEEKVDVRFVCATNRDPLAEVREQRFREDLYYRLHVIPIHLPPLREREDDVTLIAQKLVLDYAQEEGKGFRGIDPEAQDSIRAYPWPGNVRELQNVLRNVVVLNDGAQVSREILPELVRQSTIEEPLAAAEAKLQATSAEPHGEVISLREVERRAIEHAVALCDGNIPRAAALLEVSPSTIYRKRQAWRSED